jgi:hypothetical protein
MFRWIDNDNPGQSSENITIKEINMGHKGVSIRKPKKSRPFSSADISGFSSLHSDESPSVHSLVNNVGAIFKRDSLNNATGSNKKHKKGN